MHNLIDLITGKPKKGATVQLTINSAAQQAAYKALQEPWAGARAWSAINPQTGAILALASYPTFDPNLLATLDGTQLNKNDKPLLNDPNHPLINRAINVDVPARLDVQDRDELHRVQQPGRSPTRTPRSSRRPSSPCRAPPTR